jgi:hypothetical protein
VILSTRLENLDLMALTPGTRHQFLVFKTARLALPSNPEYSIPQLKMMLSEVEKILGRTIVVDEWNNL